jgi:hypothetical protein
MILKVANLFFSFCILFLSASGQPDSLVLTHEQNINWLNELKRMPLDKQLSAINKRLLSDTNVFIREYYPDGIKGNDKPLNKVYGTEKPMIVIGEVGGVPINNNTKPGSILELTNLFSLNTIKIVNILNGDDPKNIAIFGTFGSGGVVIMTLTKSKYKKKFRRINFKQDKE